MAENFLTGLLFIAMGGVLVVLALGIINLYRDSAQARSTSNKLMRLRVLLQFVAVLLIAGIYFLKDQFGGG